MIHVHSCTPLSKKQLPHWFTYNPSVWVRCKLRFQVLQEYQWLGNQAPPNFREPKKFSSWNTQMTHTHHISPSKIPILTERRPTNAWTKDFANHLARPSGRFCKTWSNSAVEGGAWRDEGISWNFQAQNVGFYPPQPQGVHLAWYNPVYDEPINCCQVNHIVMVEFPATLMWGTTPKKTSNTSRCLKRQIWVSGHTFEP